MYTNVFTLFDHLLKDDQIVVLAPRPVLRRKTHDQFPLMPLWQ